jgi:uncharacterized protein (DUF1697 family)
VALLRGINVGRHQRMVMADLRALLVSLGYDDVRTYLQSGNAVFTGPPARAAEIERRIASQIRADSGLDVMVLVRRSGEFSRVADENPFIARGARPKELHVTFLSEKPPAKRIATLDRDAFHPDDFEFGERVIYLRLPNGVMASRLPDWERLLGLTATSRSWGTVTRLRDLAAG